MNEQQFWNLVEDFKLEAAGDVTQRRAAAVRRLVRLPVEDILDFAGVFDGLLDKLYDYALWAAARIMLEGCSDDGFMDFRCWLISCGREFFSRVLADPENLADDYENSEPPMIEQFGTVAADAYLQKTARYLYEDVPPMESRKPTGQPVEEVDLAARCPRLFARYRG